MVKGESTLDSIDSQLAEIYQSKQFSEKFKAKLRASSQPGPFGLRTNLNWRQVCLMITMHVLLMIGAVAGTQAKWQSYVCYVFLTVCNTLGATAGAHRLWCHRCYKAKLPYRILVMCFNCVAWQGSILSWCKTHRAHHKYSDTDTDPHNPERGFFFAHIGWLMMRRLPQALIKRKMIDTSDLRQDSVVMFQHRYYHRLCLFFSLLLPTFVPYYFWNESLFVSFFFLFGCRHTISTHCLLCINSFAHRWGYRPYDKNINAAENNFVNCITYGEGYHNFHHNFPFDYSHGEWGAKLNVTTCFIDLCAALGLVYDRKQVSQETILKTRQRKGDLLD